MGMGMFPRPPMMGGPQGPDNNPPATGGPPAPPPGISPRPGILGARMATVGGDPNQQALQGAEMVRKGVQQILQTLPGLADALLPLLQLVQEGVPAALVELQASGSTFPMGGAPTGGPPNPMMG